VKQQAVTGTSGTTGSAGTSGGGTTGTAGTGSVITPETCNGPGGKCTDFEPTTTTNPVFGPNVPPSAAGSFGTPSGNPPCVTEPEDGTLFPNNWLRPRVRVPGNTGLLKITFHADKETTDLVAYVSGESWALPKDVWMNLARHVVEEDISVTVQPQSGGATTIKFQVAPVGAAGSMVFWAADPSQVGKTTDTLAQSAIVNDSVLKGFTVGDESTVDTLTILDVQQQVGTQGGMTQGSHCIGCHVGTPDGNFVGFVDSWPWSAVIAGVKPDPVTMKTGAAMTSPNYAGGSCTSWNSCTTPRTFIQFPWAGPMAFSKSHWTNGDHIAVLTSQMQNITMPWSTDNWQPGKLAWIDLEQASATTNNNGLTIPVQETAFGYLARTNDPHPAAAFPTWSHDGNSIVYVSAACASPGQTNGCGTQDGRLYKGPADLYEIPYANHKGGNATPVAGAADPAVEEYYPAFSPDDKLIAFTGVPSGQEMYANPSAELYVVSHGAAAGKATKLRANMPVQCSGKISPGVNNHWPKWAPDATSANGRTYYWIIFSSNRYGLPPVTSTAGSSPQTVEVSQLYITGVEVDETGVVYSYPAIYLWNQPQNRLNTTPAWENFHIPIVID
jgi:hypothetical protein